MDLYEPATDARMAECQLRMREVNQRIFEFGSRLASRSKFDRQLYGFYCECGAADCVREIRLQLHRFDPSMPAGSLLAHATGEWEDAPL